MIGFSAQANTSPLGANAASDRLALLIGNRTYPSPDDLPPIPKNVRDLKAVLEKRDFQVTDALDLDVAASRRALDAFMQKVRGAPPDATVLFYFAGHGLQVESENLLVASGVSPRAQPDVLQKGSLTLLGDVLSHMQRGPDALTIGIVDACRTDLRSSLRPQDGMNQVEAPPGCLIAFSTGAGRPALAPVAETQSTFYTASLVKVMDAASDEISFSDLFRLVRLDVQRTMLSHPVEAVRKLAQNPFIAENTRRRVRLTSDVRLAQKAPLARQASEDEAWTALERSLWPAEVARLADDFLQRFPNSGLAGSAEVAKDGATEAAKILRRNDVRLFRSSFQPSPDIVAERLQDLYKAGRGDKDAAARMGRSYRGSSSAALHGNELSRYEGWMQYAALLGNGIASYELALHYRRTDQPQLASVYESRARELGYTPPPSLDHFRK